MTIKSDRWIRRMALEHKMIEPFDAKNFVDFRGEVCIIPPNACRGGKYQGQKGVTLPRI